MRESTNAGKVARRTVSGHELLVASPCFVIEHFAANQPLTLAVAAGRSSAQVLVAVEGSAALESEGCQPVSFNCGEAVVIPAGIQQISLRPQWAVEFLVMRVPGEPGQPPVVEKPMESIRTPE